MWMADPHIISALREKRAELSGELIAAEKRIVELRADIDSLDRTILAEFAPLPARLQVWGGGACYIIPQIYLWGGVPIGADWTPPFEADNADKSDPGGVPLVADLHSDFGSHDIVHCQPV
jgi:hypothetical protein